MNITYQQLKRIIQEEAREVLNERAGIPGLRTHPPWGRPMPPSPITWPFVIWLATVVGREEI